MDGKTDDLWQLMKQLKELKGCDDESETEADPVEPQPKDKPVKAGNGANSITNSVGCPCCGTLEIILEDGNYYCIKCSTLVDRFLDASAEWRFYGGDDNRSNDPTRCGLPTNELLPDSSLGSIIGFGSKETHDIRIMRKYHMWNSMTYKERSLYNIFDTLTVNAINNGISKSIIDEAKMLYKKISEMKISRGDNRNGLIASSIYMSCKNNNVPRSAKEIAKIFNLKLPVMTKGCKRFQEIMKMNVKSTTAEDFICRFCSKINIEKGKRDTCKFVVHKAEELGIVSENTPPSVAVGSIYLCNVIFKWGINKKELSDACEISQVTVSKCFKKLYQYRDLIFENTSSGSGSITPQSECVD